MQLSKRELKQIEEDALDKLKKQKQTIDYL